jgi:hypothetical protein
MGSICGSFSMNCQSPRHRGADPKLLARRWFLRDCAVGLGSLALADLDETVTKE